MHAFHAFQTLKWFKYIVFWHACYNLQVLIWILHVLHMIKWLVKSMIFKKNFTGIILWGGEGYITGSQCKMLRSHLDIVGKFHVSCKILSCMKVFWKQLIWHLECCPYDFNMSCSSFLSQRLRSGSYFSQKMKHYIFLYWNTVCLCSCCGLLGFKSPSVIVLINLIFIRCKELVSWS